MSLLHWLNRLYSLDTLDTRFTVSSKTPLKDAGTELREDPATRKQDEPIQQPLTQGSGSARSTGQPSKWNTPEFYVYYVVFLVCIPLMFKSVMDISQESDPQYPKFAPLLSEGWIPGRKVDNSDQQYASFRNNIPIMAAVVPLHWVLRKAYDNFFRINTYTQVPQRPDRNLNGLTQGLPASAAADARMQHRLTFDLYFALAYITILHGFSAAKILAILYINYSIAKQLPRQYIVPATWVFNIAILFANELYRGYPLARVAALLMPQPTTATNTDPPTNWGQWIDSYGGVIPRWEVLFNLTILRLISFNLDYCWSLDKLGGSPIEKKQLDPANLSERDRVTTPAKPHDYTLRNYLSYALYSPLYLTGPILTFNDYISQSRYKPASITPTRTLLYFLRFLLILLTMELVLHHIYAVAISKAHPTWQHYTPFQLSMLGYFNLHIIWLKLLIPWRFFRLWSLLDAIDPPENMVRCMSDNYSALAFWRGWHRSFNRWIVRYIYVPLGGSAGGRVRATGNFLAVFTFVALWHDIQLRLLMWGWLVTLFVLPEVLASWAFPRRKWASRPTAYRVICGVGAVGNVLMMMAANLVGFAVGLDGLKGLVEGIVGSWSGVVFLGCACAALFVGVQVMFEVRESEARKGIRMTC